MLARAVAAALPPNAVLFDLWGTLATAPPTLGDDALRRALAAARVDRPFADVKAAWEKAEAAEPDDDAERDLEARFFETFRGIGMKARFAKTGAKDARKRYVEELGAALRPYPETLETLRALPAGVRIGVVSNFPDPAVLKRALDRMGLSGRLDAVACSGECGRRKPDPAPFRLALERLGVPAAEAVMVGDGEDDVAGAVALGMRAVFVARDGRSAPAGAVAAVRDLSEVPATLAGLT